MSKTVQINVAVDVTNPVELAALNTFLHAIGGQPTITGKVAEVTRPANNIPVVDPEVVEPAKKEKVAPAEAEAATEEKTEEPKSDIKIDDLRELTSEKAVKHKVAIKKKLTELGSNNVTSLNPSKFKEYLDYLNSLD